MYPAMKAQTTETTNCTISMRKPFTWDNNSIQLLFSNNQVHLLELLLKRLLPFHFLVVSSHITSHFPGKKNDYGPKIFPPLKLLLTYILSPPAPS